MNDIKTLLTDLIAGVEDDLEYECYAPGRETRAARDEIASRYTAMLDLLKRAGDAIEALDGTNVENEKLVDDYRALMARLA